MSEFKPSKIHQQFDRYLEREEYIHANLINATYDAVAFFDTPEHRLEKAMTFATDFHATILPGGKDHGYETARDAQRWLFFRGLYLKRIVRPYLSMDESGPEERQTVHGLDGYRSFAEKLMTHLDEQQHARASLEMGDSFYMGLYAAMDVRRARAREGHSFFPLEEERELAVTMLWDTMQHIIKAACPDNEQRYSGTIQTENFTRPFTLETNYYIDDSEKLSFCIYTKRESEYDSTEITLAKEYSITKYPDEPIVAEVVPISDSRHSRRKQAFTTMAAVELTKQLVQNFNPVDAEG